MNYTYAFGGTFAFLPAHRAKQKNAKEPPSQRTKTYQVNGQYHDRKEGRTANMGYTTMAGEVVNQTFVLLINSSGKLKVSASKPPLRVAPNRYHQC